MNDICKITIYTQTGALSFDVVASGKDFDDRLAAALEQGSVVLDTVEGSRLILCALNVVAIEIQPAVTTLDIPPVQKIK